MDTADIERMAREAGVINQRVTSGDEPAYIVPRSAITRFAALVETAAMEKAAEIASDATLQSRFRDTDNVHETQANIAAAIRAAAPAP